jgi:hypothetical protein
MVGGAVIGPREELIATGTLGAAGVALLYRTVRQVVRLRNLPPPPGLTAWTADALHEAAHDVLAHRRGVARLLTLATSSTNEDSFRAQLWTLVANDLTSAGRRTERGRLAERLRDMLPHVPNVSERDGVLHLDTSDSRGAEHLGDEPRYDELVGAASTVRVVVPAWNPLSTHAAPVADRDSLIAMIQAVLQRAANGLPFATLVDVLAARLGVHDAPVAAEHDVLDALAPPAADDPAAISAARDAAGRLLARLTVAQQLVLPYLGETATVVAAHTGLGRTKAWQTIGATRLLLAELLDGDPSPETTLREATTLVRQRWGL